MDKEWEHVPVGSSKIPNSQEVRVNNKTLNPNRKYLVKDCISETRSCSEGKGCGTMTIAREQGPYGTIVRDWNYMAAGMVSRGDLTYDSATGVVFILWDAGTEHAPDQPYGNSSTIFVEGIASDLSENEIERVLKRSTEPWTLKLDETRTRIYSIRCATDGLPSSDLAQAVSLVRCIRYLFIYILT